MSPPDLNFLKSTYAKQIDMLVNLSLDFYKETGTWEELGDRLEYAPKKPFFHSHAFETTGNVPHSIFADLPDDPDGNPCWCLVYCKGYPNRAGHAYWIERLGLETNDLIPRMVPSEYRFSREQLVEFASLQLIARGLDHGSSLR